MSLAWVSNAAVLSNELPFPFCVCHPVYNSYGFSLSQVNGSSCIYTGSIHRFIALAKVTIAKSPLGVEPVLG